MRSITLLASEVIGFARVASLRKSHWQSCGEAAQFIIHHSSFIIGGEAVLSVLSLCSVDANPSGRIRVQRAKFLYLGRFLCDLGAFGGVILW